MTDDTSEKFALRHFDPDGNLVAISLDGGGQWVGVRQKGQKKPPALRQYARRIAALAPLGGPTPSWERRIVNSFAPLADADIMAGWAPLGDFLVLPDDAFDGIVVPFGVVDDADLIQTMETLRRIGKTIFLDIDVDDLADRSRFETITEGSRAADAVLVPSDMAAIVLRKFNAHAFTVPPTLNAQIWRAATREARGPGPVRLAVQDTPDRFVTESVAWAREHWGEKLVVTHDNWRARSIYDDPAFYTAQDVLVVGAPEGKTQLTGARLIPAMAGGCMIVADAAYNRTVQHAHSGLLVAQRGPSPWRKAITHAVTDGRTRLCMQQGAKNRSRLFIGRTQLSRLAMPYRVMFR